GRYTRDTLGVDMYNREGKLVAEPLRGGKRMEFRKAPDARLHALDFDNPAHPYWRDDRLGIADERLTPLEAGQIVFNRDMLTRVDVPRPPPPAAELNGLIGEHGWPHNTLYILKKDGK